MSRTRLLATVGVVGGLAFGLAGGEYATVAGQVAQATPSGD